MSLPARELIERTFRDGSGRAVATLTRVTGDLDLAEEAVQEAYVVALERWPTDGVPDNPAAWITTVARNRAIDRVRRRRRLEARHAALVHDAAAKAAEQERALLEAAEDDMTALSDDRLRLIFTCCHPAIAAEARVALTLRTLGGLTTTEIARAFLMPEATVAQRVVRAKRKIREAAIPYRVPPDDQLPERLEAVLAVLYLVFNEGYLATSSDELIRQDLCREAVRLARVLVSLMPDEPEALGLLALLLLQDARREARLDERGRLVLLEDQDRERWDGAEIAEGTVLLERALRMRRPGSYQLQAAIAAVHDGAATAGETDWPQILALYDTLARLEPSGVVELNRAVAVAMVHGPDAGLDRIEALRETLDGYPYLHATRADLLRRVGRIDEAVTEYRRAAGLVATAAEQAFLESRVASLDDRA